MEWPQFKMAAVHKVAASHGVEATHGMAEAHGMAGAIHSTEDVRRARQSDAFGRLSDPSRDVNTFPHRLDRSRPNRVGIQSRFVHEKRRREHSHPHRYPGRCEQKLRGDSRPDVLPVPRAATMSSLDHGVRRIRRSHTGGSSGVWRPRRAYALRRCHVLRRHRRLWRTPSVAATTWYAAMSWTAATSWAAATSWPPATSLAAGTTSSVAMSWAAATLWTGPERMLRPYGLRRSLGVPRCHGLQRDHALRRHHELRQLPGVWRSHGLQQCHESISPALFNATEECCNAGGTECHPFQAM